MSNTELLTPNSGQTLKAAGVKDLSRKRLAKETRQALGIGVALAPFAAAAGWFGAQIIDTEMQKNRQQDAAMEQVIKPTAQNIAQFVIDTAPNSPRTFRNEYIYEMGQPEAGQTTLIVHVRKVEGEEPAAGNVTWAQLTDYAAPGAEGNAAGPQFSQSLQLDGSTWVAVSSHDAPQSYESFADNLEDAQHIVEAMQDHMEYAYDSLNAGQ